MAMRRALLALLPLVWTASARADGPPGTVCGPTGCRIVSPAYQQLQRYRGTMPDAVPTGDAPPAGDGTEVSGEGGPDGDPAPSPAPAPSMRGGCSTCPGTRGSAQPPSPSGFAATGGGAMAAKGGCGGGSCAVRGGGILQAIGSFFARLFGRR